MKKISKIFALFAIISLMFASCSPETYDLGAIDVKSEDLVEGIAFKIEHDATNPNIIYLTSLMDSKYTPLWSHPQGRSQKQTVTLKIPFPGTYEVKFGVETRGGAVYGEVATFTVDDFYSGFVDNELWTLISGGVGNEKTWYLDLDANGISRYFAGPLYFYGTDDSWETVTNGVKLPDGSDSWNWNPDWAGNTWLMNAADFGSMTFNLKNGANVVVEHKTISSRGTETGTYMLDVDEHTLRMNDASPLHDSGRDNVVVDWGNIKILSLTENTMQLGVLRDPALSGEGACLLVYNFISKDYYDNWVPGEAEPPYNGSGNDDLTSTFTKKWQLSLDSPYNWTELDGEFLYSLSSPTDYTTEGFSYDEDLVEDVTLTMTKTSTSGGNYTFTDGDANPISGTYTIDSKNNILFNKDIDFAISGSVSLTTTAEKSLRIIRSSTDLQGNITGIWLGKRSATKGEYLVYHFELATSENTTTGTEVTFDPSKIVFGDLENNGNLRIEIYNDYGSTKANPPLSTALAFAKRLEVTFTLSGITLKTGAAGTYNASIYYADADWNPNGNGSVTTVSGNGTYTVKYAPTTACDGMVVFVVDVKGLAKDVTDLSAVTATVNKIVIK